MYLRRRLLDGDLARDRSAGAAVTRPAQGRRAQFIEPDGDPHMGVGGAKSVDAPARHVLAVVVARGQAQHLDHAGGGRLVAVGDQMRDADTHERGQPVCEGGTYRTACARPSPLAAVLRLQRPLYIRYCSAMAAPRRLLLSMSSLMNSCIPCWKISSIRLFSSWARTARAWRWAGPWRP